MRAVHTREGESERNEDQPDGRDESEVETDREVMLWSDVERRVQFLPWHDDKSSQCQSP